MKTQAQRARDLCMARAREARRAAQTEDGAINGEIRFYRPVADYVAAARRWNRKVVSPC